MARFATAGPSFPWPRSLVGSLKLRFGPHFTPAVFRSSINLRRSQAPVTYVRSASSFSSRCFCVVRKHSALHGNFVGQPVSECIDTPANRADRNEFVLFVSYARLGAHMAPTDVPRTAAKNASASCGDIGLSMGAIIAAESPPIVDVRPRNPRGRVQSGTIGISTESVTPKHSSTSAIGYQHQIKVVREAPAYRAQSSSAPPKRGWAVYNQWR